MAQIHPGRAFATLIDPGTASLAQIPLRGLSFRAAFETVACAAAILLVGGCGEESTPRSSGSPSPVVRMASARNVVLVTIDTLRADVLEIYGGPAQVPALRELADAGWVADECFSAAMLTNPSHVSIMTALYPRDHGVYDNHSRPKSGLMTLSRALKNDGFRTAAVVGFRHLNAKSVNLGNGFDHFPSMLGSMRPGAYVTQLALNWLDGVAKDERFFLWVHYAEPHWPYTAAPVGNLAEWEAVESLPMADVVAASSRNFRNNRDFIAAERATSTTSTLLRRYIGEVEVAAQHVGALRAGLTARGRNDETLWVITSDHGESLGEHRLFFHHGGLYDATTRVPLILSGPGLEPTRVGGMVSGVDLAPTILSLVGVPTWPGMSGQSLVSGDGRPETGRRPVFSEHRGGLQVAVRRDGETLIVHRKSSDRFPSMPIREGAWELYDRHADPYETRPLRDAERANPLHEEVRRFIAEDPKIDRQEALDVDTDALRALGYLE